MKKSNLNLVWACNTRADTSEFEILKLIREAGCVKIKVGIESIHPRIRNGIYQKHVTNKQIKELIKNCKKLDIQLTGFFMLGAPTETKKEVWDTISFAINSDLTEANFSITSPLPATSLYDYVRGHGWALPTDFSGYDYYQVKRPKMSDKEINVNTLKFYKKMANLMFYLHPKRSMNTFKNLLVLKKTLLKFKRI
jgi:radical SAM superfamily enzyme YgiQ (UPF0313 family)